ncbi:cilia- and flagella-associated protein 100-like isoform 2-T3 [Polymixia lowei]
MPKKGSESTNLLSRRRSIADGEKKGNSPFSLPKVDIKHRGTNLVFKEQFHQRLPTLMKSSAPLRHRAEEPVDDADAHQAACAAVVNKSKGHSPNERESVRDFVTKHKEMFRLQYSLLVKKQAIKQLEMNTEKEYQGVCLAKKNLDEVSVAFDEFLEEVEQKSMEAVKTAEQQTMLKIEKIAERKKVAAQVMAVKKDISKSQDILNEYQTYKKFLMDVAPAEWREKQKHKKAEKEAIKLMERQIKEKNRK